MVDGNWGEWRNHILEEIKRIAIAQQHTNDKIDDVKASMTKEIYEIKDSLNTKITQAKDILDKDISLISNDVATLKAKASIWGAIAGTIFGGTISFIIDHFKGK